jgi:small redox-active disulfide protein 2
MEIKVLGPGCMKCNKTEKIIKKTIEETGIEATLEKVTDMLEIAAFGVMGTPAVIVNGKIKSVGKIPKKEEIISWLEK